MPTRVPCLGTRIFALSVLLVVNGCSKAPDQAEDIRPVLTQTIALGADAAQARYAGEVKARYEVPLGFRIAGKVISRHAEVGSSVKKGQLLARLDPADHQINVANAKAQVAAARADFEQARGNLARYRDLLGQKFISAIEFDRHTNAFNVAQAKLEQAQAQLGFIANQAEYTALVADQAGIITAVSAEVGQVVGIGQIVMRLARPEEKEVLISLPENKLAEARTATPIRIVLWAAPERRYAGRIREIAPSADAATRTYAVKVAFMDADESVRLGMTAYVLFGRSGSAAVAQLPLTALTQKDGKAAVWVVEPASGQVKLRPIEVSQYRESTAVVTRGLENGDRVVTAGVHKLKPDQKVRARDASAPPGVK